MHRRTSPKTFVHATALRHHLTGEETRMWQVLRSHRFAGVHFRRQHAIGPYIVDFYSPRCKLVIELDGSQHHDQQEHDTERTAFLESKGYRVLRFWNNEVAANLEGVILSILSVLEQD